MILLDALNPPSKSPAGVNIVETPPEPCTVEMKWSSKIGHSFVA